MAVAIVPTLALLPCRAFAQYPPDSSKAAPDVAALVEGEDPERNDLAAWMDHLTSLAERPLDVNRASAEELAQIPALGWPLARRIVRERSHSGPFGTLTALRRIEGMTEERLREAIPFLDVVRPLPAEQPASYPPTPSVSDLINQLSFDGMQRVTRRLDLGRGYAADSAKTGYIGSPDRVYTRLHVYAAEHFSANLTLEKDPGETFTWEPGQHTYGFDFASAHMAFRDMGRLVTLVLGDFTASFGQGLALWQGSALGKGTDLHRGVARMGTGIRPYRGANEYTFFRGGAATVRVAPSLSISAFASRRALDASPGTTDDSDLPGYEDGGAASIYESGLHRTPSELAKKRSLEEVVAGGALVHSTDWLEVGSVAYHARFSRPLASGTRPDTRFDFTGQEAYIISAFVRATIGNAQVFGEGARDPRGSFGGLAGLEIGLSRYADVVVLARHYPRDFTSLHGNAFREQSSSSGNEYGYYVGLRVRPARNWRVSGHFDQYHHPWLRYGVLRPTSGFEAAVRLEHRFSSQATYYLQARSETKEQATTMADLGGRSISSVAPTTRQALRAHTSLKVGKHLRFQSRVELSRFFEPTQSSSGTLLYQDVRWAPSNNWRVDFRLVVFDTDDYAARIYAFENDLVYAFSMPSFQGQGERAYVLFSYTPTQKLQLQLKYARTVYRNVTHVGSGLEEVEGNQIRDLKAQIRIRI